MGPERRAVNARVALVIDFCGMNDRYIGPDCRDYVDIGSRAIRVTQGLPLVDACQFTAMYAGDRLERDSVGGCTQPRDQGHSGVFFEMRFLALDGFAVPARKTEVAFHCNDARANFCDCTGTAQQIKVVAG